MAYQYIQFDCVVRGMEGQVVDQYLFLFGVIIIIHNYIYIIIIGMFIVDVSRVPIMMDGGLYTK